MLTPAAAADLVAARGAAMQAAADATPGTMAAVLGLGDDAVVEVCADVDDAWVANLNAPGQAVVAGTPEGVAAAGEKAKEAGAKRVMALPVGGAFHSPLMASAAGPLAEALAAAPLADAAVPVVADVDAALHRQADTWRRRLLEQLTAPVRWRQVQHALFELGVTAVVELGPGGVLTGLAKRTLPDTPRLSVASPEDLPALLALAEDAAPGASPPDGDQLHGDERMIVSPSAGSFEPADELAPGRTIDRGHLVGTVGGIDVRSAFAGLLGGVLALPGERLAPAQPIAWLWAR